MVVAHVRLNQSRILRKCLVWWGCLGVSKRCVSISKRHVLLPRCDFNPTMDCSSTTFGVDHRPSGPSVFLPQAWYSLHR